MKKIEYKTIRIGTAVNVDKLLNEMADNGWELVTSAGTSDVLYFTFKKLL